MEKFFINLQTAFNLSDITISYLIVASVILLYLVKAFYFFTNQIQNKEDKQFEVLREIINDDNYIQKLKSRPYIIKQLFFKRLYALKRYQVSEIEFLLTLKNINITLYQLDSIKSGGLLKFKDNQYFISKSILDSFWIAQRYKASILFLLLFLILIVFLTILTTTVFKSLSFFSLSVLFLIFLEVYLINKGEAIKDYIDAESELHKLIDTSILYRDNNDV